MASTPENHGIGGAPGDTQHADHDPQESKLKLVLRYEQRGYLFVPEIKTETKPNEQNFTCFPEFPTEIRLRILASSFEPLQTFILSAIDLPRIEYKTVSIDICSSANNAYPRSAVFKPPTLLHVNRETRMEERKNYHLLFPVNEFQRTPVYFNPQVDTIGLTWVPRGDVLKAFYTPLGNRKDRNYFDVELAPKLCSVIQSLDFAFPNNRLRRQLMYLCLIFHKTKPHKDSLRQNWVHFHPFKSLWTLHVIMTHEFFRDESLTNPYIARKAREFAENAIHTRFHPRDEKAHQNLPKVILVAGDEGDPKTFSLEREQHRVMDENGKIIETWVPGVEKGTMLRV